MVRQDGELYHRLEDTEKLWLYALSVASKHHALEDGLGKAKSKHWERKAKEGIERATTIEKERDEAKEEAQATRLTVVMACDANG